MIVTQENLLQVRSTLNSLKDPICIDTETNFTDNLDSRFCLGIAIATPTEYFYIPVGHKPIVEGFVPDNVVIDPDFFDELKCPVVFHNAKFDLLVLRKMGMRYQYDEIYDTMLMAHYIQSDRMGRRPYSLETLAEKYCVYQKDTSLAKIMKPGWEVTPISAMAKYAEDDVRATLELFNVLWPDYEEFNKECWETFDKDFMYLCIDIEWQGLRLDKVKCAELEILCKTRMAEIKKELKLNPASPKQVAERLFSEVPTGLGIVPKVFTKTGPSTDSAVLETINHPVAGLILEYRALSKQAGSYFRNYLDNVGDGDRLHPSFKLHGTITGRTSCELPNLHQIPRDSDVKKMFLPEPGYELWEVDYSALEPRLAAVYSNCRVLIDLFASNGDFHQLTADKLGISRQDGKIVNLTLMYGGAQALEIKLRKPYQYCQRLVKEFQKAYPEIYKLKRDVQASAEKNGYIRLFSGRVRTFSWGWGHKDAFNTIIQGGGFEILKRSMILLHKEQYILLNQVHDSVWLMVKNEGEVIEAEKIMTGWTEEAFGLKFAVERKRLR